MTNPLPDKGERSGGSSGGVLALSWFLSARSIRRRDSSLASAACATALLKVLRLRLW
jgi:hypothetical protein